MRRPLSLGLLGVLSGDSHFLPQGVGVLLSPPSCPDSSNQRQASWAWLRRYSPGCECEAAPWEVFAVPVECLDQFPGHSGAQAGLGGREGAGVPLVLRL